jgi:hypothetical protein
MQKFSIKSFSISFAIIIAIICFWFMQIQVLQQKKVDMSSSSMSMSMHKVSTLGEKAKQLFGFAQNNVNASVNLVGIIHNKSNPAKSYIILNIDGKNFIYREGQNLPSLGKLSAINRKDIDFESATGAIQKLFISTNKSENTTQTNDMVYATGVLPPLPANMPEPIVYGQDINNPNNPNNPINPNSPINSQAMDSYAPPPNSNNTQNMQGVVQAPSIPQPNNGQ